MNVPTAVFTIWWIGLLLTLLVFVPLAVYLLHRTWRAARSIERYAAEALQAAAGIVENTRAITARPLGYQLSDYGGPVEGWDEFKGYYQGRRSATDA